MEVTGQLHAVAALTPFSALADTNWTGWNHGGSGYFEKKLLMLRGIEPRSVCHPTHILVAIPTEPSRLNTLICHVSMAKLPGHYSNCDRFLNVLDSIVKDKRADTNVCQFSCLQQISPLSLL
jgi:hypothetical protein